MDFNFKAEIVNSFLQLGKTSAQDLLHRFSWCRGRCGVVFGALVFSLSRNPSEEAVYLSMQCWVLLNRSSGLLALMMAFLILFS
jgi:hypothetical protein